MNTPADEPVRLPAPCLVVLVGPGASGKSTWAAATVPADQIVSSDRLRALVGAGEDDITASDDAFAVLDDVLRRRLARGLTTVVDTLGLDTPRRLAWLALARAHRMAAVAVAFDTPPAECRARNRLRSSPIPAAALTRRLAGWAAVRDGLVDEGWDRVLTPRPLQDHVPLHEAGVGEVMVSLPDLADPDALDRLGAVIAAFR